MKHDVILQSTVLVYATIESRTEADMSPDAVKALIALKKDLRDLVGDWAAQHGYRLVYPTQRMGGPCSEIKE